VLVFDTLPGLFIGIAVSFVLLLYRASRPNVAVLGRVPGVHGQYTDVVRHPDNEPIPGIVVLRPESGLFFANADAVRDRIRRAVAAGTKGIVLDAATMPFIDVTAATMLGQLVEDLEREGVRLVLARDIGQVRDLLGASEAGGMLRAYPTIEDAVEALGREPAIRAGD
jgi:MFS superfamily sulfate permease-like transporter